MAGFDIATQIFQYMDEVTTTSVADNISAITQAVAPVVALGLTLSLTIEGLFLMARPSGEPLSMLITKFVRWAIIISIASAGGWYQTSLANVALKTPDEFSQILVIHSSGDPQHVSQVIDQCLQQGLAIAKTAFNSASVLSGPGIASGFLGAMALISTVVICGVGMGLILMSKFLLAITVCFGPIFIYCLLFKSVQNLFTKWVGSVINYGLVTVLLTMTFGLLMSFYSRAISAAAANNPSSPVMMPLLACGLITVVALMVLKQVPEMAARWGDGVIVNISSRFGAEGASGGAGGGAGGGGGGSRGNSTVSPSSAVGRGASTERATNGFARGSRRS